LLLATLTATVVAPRAALGIAPKSTRTQVGGNQTEGKRLYRKYCGQCHALTAARAVGFGTNNGLGTDGGPSFNHLRIPYSLSVLAITQPFIGHEVLYYKMTLSQIKTVSHFVAKTTLHHPLAAKPIDG